MINVVIDLMLSRTCTVYILRFMKIQQCCQPVILWWRWFECWFSDLMKWLLLREMGTLWTWKWIVLCFSEVFRKKGQWATYGYVWNFLKCQQINSSFHTKLRTLNIKWWRKYSFILVVGNSGDEWRTTIYNLRERTTYACIIDIIMAV